MARSSQRNTKNSIRGAVVQYESRALSVPEVLVPLFDLDGFRPWWDAFTSCRTPDNWKDWELVEVSEICREKIEIAELEADVEQEGKVIHFPNGAVSSNPKWKMIQDLKKSYMSRIRLIGIHDVKQQARSNGSVSIKDIDDDGADLI